MGRADTDGAWQEALGLEIPDVGESGMGPEVRIPLFEPGHQSDAVAHGSEVGADPVQIARESGGGISAPGALGA
jgi:hypothetical protein